MLSNENVLVKHFFVFSQVLGAKCTLGDIKIQGLERWYSERTCWPPVLMTRTHTMDRALTPESRPLTSTGMAWYWEWGHLKEKSVIKNDFVL